MPQLTSDLESSSTLAAALRLFTSSSYSLAFSIFIAVARFLCWLRSPWQATTMPEGMMPQAHRRLGLVHVLATGAAGTEHIHLDVGRIEIDLDVVVDLRRDEHRRKRGVAAVAGIERALAHQAVHAGLGAQPAIGVFALEGDRAALHARHFAGVGIHAPRS